MVVLRGLGWDLPGAGAPYWPSKSYILDTGLRYFDAVIFVISNAPLEIEVGMLRQLREHGVPHYVVRTKIDQDVVNNQEDAGRTAAETLAEVRAELLNCCCGDAANIYLISSRLVGFEFEELVSAISADISKQCVEVFGAGYAAKLSRTKCEMHAQRT